MEPLDKGILNWLQSAEYDLETAHYMLETRRYIYTVFMCHLALEKTLKAAVEKSTCALAPKTHDLEHLLRLSGLQPNKTQESAIAGLSNLSIATRYPKDFSALYKSITRKRAERTLKQTMEALRWIRKSLTL